MKALAYLNKYLFKYKKLLFFGTVFVVISNIFAIYPARIVRNALDMVQEALVKYKDAHSDPSLENLLHTQMTRSLLIFGLVVLGMAILRGVFMFFMRQTIIVMSRHIEFDLKNEIFAQYQRLSLSFYRKNNTGDLMNRISEDVNRVRMYVGPAIMYTINLFAMFVMIIGAMLFVNARMTLLVLLPLPLMSVAIYYVNGLINKRSERVQESLSSLSTYVQETFSGIRILKSFSREEQFREDFNKEADAYLHKSMQLAKVNSVFSPAILTLIGLSTILTIYIGGKEVIAGRMTAGNIAEFIIYINMLTWPFASIGWVTSIIQRASASQQRLNEFLQLKPEISSPTSVPCDIQGNIEFKEVYFSYPHSKVQILKGLSFRIEQGKSLAILGKTGSGKSTIAQLLVRLYDATAGEILVDGRNIKDLHLESLRKACGYVPQDVFLFSDSIFNNIVFGLNEEDGNLKERAENAAKNAALYENIISFPKAFETLIGERGITLSGGQKQRLSIARAIIKNPKILILDDCLSAVDTHTEEIILKNMEEIMKGRSSIIISHRASSVKNADHIIVLDEGLIVEEGNHESLMKIEGTYKDLYDKQLLEMQQTII